MRREEADFLPLSPLFLHPCDVFMTRCVIAWNQTERLNGGGNLLG